MVDVAVIAIERGVRMAPLSAGVIPYCVTAQIAVTGPAVQPAFQISSNPSLPEDEILSRILFQKSAGSLSAFQALELANAVATLSGQADTFENVRKSLGVDSVDIGTSATGGALVSAMFAAELNNVLLTAGHDVDALAAPLLVDCSQAGDRFVGINGQERELKPGDMLMRDSLGIISAVLHGPDQRTRFSETTTSALFVTYAPKGIARADVQRHLEQIAANVRLTDPRAEVVDTVIL